MNLQNNQSVSSTPRSLSPPPKTQSPQDNTPTHPPPRAPSVLRKTSGFEALFREQSPAPTNGESLSENGEPHTFASVNGKGTVGKSGRIIERLTAENDRLKRELNGEVVIRQELEQREESMKAFIEHLKSENTNLIHAQESDGFLIKKKDRKIRELTEEKKEAIEKRDNAVQSSQQMRLERDEIVNRCEEEVSRANERAEFECINAKLLKNSHEQLSKEYKEKMESFLDKYNDVVAIKDGLLEHSHKLDVVVEQMSNYFEKATGLVSQMAQENTFLKGEGEDILKEMRECVTGQEQLKSQYQKELGEAKYFVNLAKNAASRPAKSR